MGTEAQQPNQRQERTVRADGTGYLCPICEKRCGLTYLLVDHLNHHAYGVHGAERVTNLGLRISISWNTG